MPVVELEQFVMIETPHTLMYYLSIAGGTQSDCRQDFGRAPQRQGEQESDQAIKGDSLGQGRGRQNVGNVAGRWGRMRLILVTVDQNEHSTFTTVDVGW